MVNIALTAFIFFGFAPNKQPSVDISLRATAQYEVFAIPLEVVLYSTRDVYRFGYLSKLAEDLFDSQLN